MILLTVVLSSIAVLWSPDCCNQQAPGAQHFLVLLKAGKQVRAADPGLQQRHIKHLEALAAEGFGLAAGPLGTNSKGISGIVLITATSLAHARELANRDPAIHAGALTAEVVLLGNLVATFGKPIVPITMETVTLAFIGQEVAQSNEALSSHVLSFRMIGSAGGHAIVSRRTIEDVRAALANVLSQKDAATVELFSWYVPRGVLP